MSTDKQLAFSEIESTNKIQLNYNQRKSCCSKENIKEQLLLIATIASVLIGIGVGFALRGLKCPTG